MSVQALERAIKNEAAGILRNPRLRNKDLLEWSTGEVNAEDGEVAIRLPLLDINVVVPVAADKRPREETA